MLDFLKISKHHKNNGVIEIYPKFIVGKHKDLMIRGGDFYAIWNEDLGLWSTDETDALRLIDRETREYFEQNKSTLGFSVDVKYLWDSDSGMIDKWHKYCQKQCRDNYQPLDAKLVFSNDPINKKDYASKRLSYPLEPGSIEAYDKLISTLYSEEERHKIEWAIGAVVSGDSKHIQKFMVLYGAAGTGKSTILNIIQKLFDGYDAVFDAKALGSSNNQFALEALKSNPLVAIQHDGDLSKIEDNTRLNSVVSHEKMTINEKFKSTYTNYFNAFLFIGTNRPVKITDAKSGLIRRLIDVAPSGNKIPPKEYKQLVEKVNFELGAIAHHCKEIYLSNPGKYDNYVPMLMLGASNDFYNFVEDYYLVFKKEDGVSLKASWEMYKNYCDDAKVAYPLNRRLFKEEMKNYFDEFIDDLHSIARFKGFKSAIFESSAVKVDPTETIDTIVFEDIDSIFDKECAEYSAQYANDEGTPYKKWTKVSTKLRHLDTSKLHYVKVPENHIVIDFDIPDENGKKSYDKNLAAASKFPATYAELSKSGAGIHLHYIYNGDVTKLSRLYDDHIEVKVFNGDSSLRRQLSKCNNLPIATISSGLPLKKEKKMINFSAVQTEKQLKQKIIKCLNKSYENIPPYTKPNIDFINKLLNDAYDSGLKYDLTDMRNAVLAFGASSTNSSHKCIKIVNQMKFKSDEPSENTEVNDAPIVFFDIEIFPNLCLINWKYAGEGVPIVRMINPKSSEIEPLLRFNLIGFNNRNYDNHMLYAAYMGYTNESLYKLSKRLIDKDSKISRAAKFGEAYNLSYTDIYDYSSKKQSLKKWEIELGITHKELGIPWDEPVPEERWLEVAEYCDNDVIAAEKLHNHLKADFLARQILADLAGMTVNDTTNTLTTKIIFGGNRKPHSAFNYRDLSKPVHELPNDVVEFLKSACPKMMAKPHGKAKSLLPYFEGYEFDDVNRVSIYRGTEVGEGGCVRAKPNMYGNVALLDIASMHPHSAIAEVIFGVEFTTRFKEIVDGRVHIKHEAWEEVNQMLDGKLTPYIQKVLDGELTSDDLAYALKIAINSVYGLTSAKFDNPFKDPRNVDNIVAKRGALFMLDLEYEVTARGFTVAHIKTDSIKIPDATPEIIQFVMEFGERYGYTFEHEATYDRMCLVNDAVYIAKYATAEKCSELYGYVPKDNRKKGGKWTATGEQFAVPYVFKSLFSKEEITFKDLCEVKSVKEGAIYIDRNEHLPDVSDEEKELTDRYKGKKRLNPNYTNYSNEDLTERISNGHNYVFIGRVGNFCPIKPGCGGGVLYRKNNDKYFAITGTKGYRWMEAAAVAALEKESDIDTSYYKVLVDKAVDTVSKYGNFEWFISNDPYVSPPFSNGKPLYIQELSGDDNVTIISDPLPDFN